MDYSNFKIPEMKNAVKKRLAVLNGERNSSQPLIDIEELMVEECLYPYIEKINSYLKVKDYAKAAETADAAINEKPDSATGWFAKIVALTRNFSPANFDVADSGVDLTHKEFVALKSNALNMSTSENSAYITASLSEYEKKCVKYLEIGSCNRFALIYDRASDPDYKDVRDMLGAVTRHSLAAPFETSPSYEYFAKQYPESLILCVEYTLLYLNNVNADKQCAYYGIGKNDDIFDHYDKRPIKNLELSKTSLTDKMKEFGFNPAKSDCVETDGFISIMIYVCDLLGIKAGTLKNYYSSSAQEEFAKAERLAREKRAEDERRKKAAEEKKREEERKKREEREAVARYEREKAEKARKRKKTTGTLIKVGIVIAVIAALVALFPVIKNGLSGVFDSSTTSRYDGTEYYVMSDDYTAINVRSGPGTENSVITVLESRDVKMFPTGTTDGNWIEVDSPDFGIGWVSTKVVKFVTE